VVSPYAIATPARSPYLKRRRRGLAGLGDAAGAISGAQAFEQAKAADSNLNPKDYVDNPNFGSAKVGAMIEAFQIPAEWTNPANCGSSAPKLSVVKTAAGIGLATAAALDPEPISKAVLMIGAAFSSMFSAIFGHHSRAVARDQAAICTIYPAMANTLQAVHDAVLNGTMTPAQGIAALAPMPGAFVQYAGDAYNHHPWCNALCEAKVMLDAFVRYWIGQFQQMQATQAANPAAGVTSAVSSAAAKAGLPAWLLWLGIAFVAWEFV
jgi:hypothetical protein